MPIRAIRGWNLSLAEYFEGELRDYEPLPSEPKAKGDQLYLVSLAARTVWPGPVLRADHKPFDIQRWAELRKRLPRGTGVRWKQEDVRAMQQAYSCGIYAVKPEFATEVQDIYQAEVMGEVDLWGRVAQFVRGYRAEYCMIRSLTISKNVYNFSYILEDLDCSIQEITDILSRRYECPVTLEK